MTERQDGGAVRELPRYKCHKEVWALKIARIANMMEPPNSVGCTDALITPSDEGYAPFTVDAAFMHKHKPEVGGYFVRYADGYTSYSPAKAFEEGYTRV